MNHEEFENLAPLHALGALDGDDLAQFAKHLAGCADCRKLLREYEESATGLAFSLPGERPSPAVRERVLAAVRERPAAVPARPFPWVPAAIALVGVALGILWLRERQRVGEMDAALKDQASQLTALREDLAKTRDDLASKRKEIDAVREDLAKAGFYRDAAIGYMKGHDKLAPAATGSVRWKDARAVVDMRGLPKLPAKKVWELWAMVPDKAPIRAGEYTVDAQGNLRRVMPDGKLGDPEFTFAEPPTKPSFAVTLEDEGGVDKPTTAQMHLLPIAN